MRYHACPHKIVDKPVSFRIDIGENMMDDLPVARALTAAENLLARGR